jgi:SNF2 family DNA or RNA helicase
MGLGKTMMALYWINKIPAYRPAVIVTPASVKYAWQSEAMQHFGMRSQVLEGVNSRPLDGSQLIILNYHILIAWLDELMKVKPRIVILDECHYICNVKAQRTAAAHVLARYAVSRLALSGTPISNRPSEFWSAIHFVRPDLYPDHGKYLWRFCRPRKTRWGWKFDGAKNIPELNETLKRECMIRRLKKNVLPELPDKIYKVIPLRLSSYKEYNRAKERFIQWLSGISLARARRAKRSKALAKVGYLLRLCAELKLPKIIEWLEEFRETHPDQKVVALTMHTAVINRLRKHFSDSVFIDGRVSGKMRFEAVRKFQSNNGTHYFFGNWKAAGMGLNLTASSTFVSLDYPWTPADYGQGQDRIHRIGQKRKVIIYNLVALDTIEEHLIQLLQKKAEVLSAVLDGKGHVRDVDLVELLLKAI